MKRSSCLSLSLTLTLSLIALPTLAKPKEALWGDPITAQSTPNQDKKAKASALGGPITPTQPNPLSADPELSPQSSKSQTSFVLEPLRPTPSGPPTSLLNDPPKPSGARFIRVQTD
jgi:hypothetical protein